MLWIACSAWLVSSGSSSSAAKFRRKAGSLEFAVRRKDALRDYPVMTAHLRHSSCDTLWRGYLQPPRSSAPQVWGRYATWPRAICVNHTCHSAAPALPTLCSCTFAENRELIRCQPRRLVKFLLFDVLINIVSLFKINCWGKLYSLSLILMTQTSHPLLPNSK